MQYLVLVVTISAVVYFPRDTEGGPLSAEAENEFKSDLEEANSPLLEAWLLKRILEICGRDSSACDDLALARLFAHIHSAGRRRDEPAKGAGGEPLPPPSSVARSDVDRTADAAAATAGTLRSVRGKRTTVINILFEIFKRLNISPRGGTLEQRSRTTGAVKVLDE